MMFQRLLVPLDGSTRAEQALPVAAHLVRAAGGTVVLLRVVSPPTELASSMPAETSPKPVDAELAEAAHYLQRVTKMGSLLDIHAETLVIPGQVATTILSTVDAHKIDLIVLCSHGYTGIKHLLLESVAEEVAHYAPVPVFLLREGEVDSAVYHQQVVDVLRVLVPLDGSVRAKAALVPAMQLITLLAAPGQRALHITRVVVMPDREQSSHSEREAILREAEQYLKATVEHIVEELAPNLATAAHAFSITWSVTIDNDIAAGIIRVAEDGEGGEVTGSSDMIAMAEYEYPEQQQRVTGSVTGRVLQGTKLPLLIVRPQQ